MKMNSQLLWRSIWLLFAALWLSACGGGGESQPTPPAVVLKPVQNAAISLQFEAPERINSEGTLAISLNAFSQEQGALQIAWTLPEDFTRLPSDDDSEGKISIKAPKVTQDTNYQIAVEIKDSKDNLARHVHQIRVLRRVSTVTITGMVTDTVIAKAKVSAWLGNEKLGESDADENGQYTLALTLGDSTAVTQPVELRANGDESQGQGFVQFRSLIPSLTSLIADSGQTDSDEVTIDTSVDFGVNITNVTSAVSSLLPQTTLESDQSLNQSLLSIDTAEVLRRATLIKLLVDKPAEYPLPEGVNDTVAFLQDSQAKQQIEEQATANGNTDFDDTQKQILEDKQLVSDNAKLAAAEYIVQLDHEAFALHLNADGTGQIHAYTSSNITWSYANRIHTITVANPVETYRDEDGWLKRLKKIELQVINQSNGRAMANITRVFDRIHNASLEDELTLVDDAIVINNRNTLLVPYQTLLGDWQISEDIYQGETFNVRLNEHGSSYDYAEQSNGSWQLANNRLLMPYNENGQPATTEIWFTTLLGEVGEQSSESFPTYRFFAIDRYDDGSNLKVIYGTFTKLMESPSQPDTRPLSQQAEIQDPTLAQCLDESGFSNLSSIKDLYCADSDLQSISSLQGLSNLTGLEKLHLGYLQPTSLSSSDFPSSIRELTIHNSKLYSVDLHSLEQLRVLNIRNTVIDAIDFASLTQLTELYLPDNPNLLSQSALSALTNLERLDLNGNQLTEIDLKGLNQLTHLFVSNNQLTALDLAHNLNLKEVYAWENNLISIDVRHLEQLEHLIIGGNQISQIDVKNNVLLKSINVFDNNISAIDISNLAQLEYFNVDKNQLTSLDVSNNVNLLWLYAESNQLMSLDIRNLNHVIDVRIGSNQLSELDLTHNLNLKEVYAWENNLVSIDVRHLEQLEYLILGGNKLSQIDVANNVFLKGLNVANNNLADVDVSKLNKLEYLNVGGNQLTSLNVSNNSVLIELYVLENKLSSFDLSSNDKLENFFALNNQLTSLDISSLPELRSLNVDGNQLASLDLSNNPKLYFLSVSDNQFTSLDVKLLPELQWLQVGLNQLTGLDLSNNPKVRHLNANENKLTSLNISHLSELSSLDVMGNQLTHLDISQNPMLYWLSVAFNQLTEFNVDHLRDLEFLQVQGNQLTNLDLINKTKLLNVNASSNQLTTISGIEDLNVNAFIDLTNNPFALEFEAYLRDLQNQGYSNLYF
ncbi:hypothetical protein BOO91_13980 [Vibrio navarrensis]|uniref:leucine-rich repeat domain-containing protein n=1 Tax=Vibrio navarrensis TaxID=29495 RepID=UPI001868C1EC|nr:leucine-rich repeat domain-containing protein [Vibrio navarrensis]MBE3662039.1 hypothetical protein [Vibrio navarrensis]